MADRQTVSVRVTHRFSAAPERVFDAWLDPAKAGKFLFATPTGKMVRVEIDARVGGAFVFVDRRDGEDVEHSGEYLEIDRPRRLVFRFRVPKYSPDFAHIAIDIVPAASGCELTLTHSELDSQWTKQAEEGWTMILNSLAANLV
jgi:uncharacterized protein YndB with AHSA1/START domain